jgi:hypothetical protein
MTHGQITIGGLTGWSCNRSARRDPDHRVIPTVQGESNPQQVDRALGQSVDVGLIARSSLNCSGGVSLFSESIFINLNHFVVRRCLLCRFKAGTRGFIGRGPIPSKTNNTNPPGWFIIQVSFAGKR